MTKLYVFSLDYDHKGYIFRQRIRREMVMRRKSYINYEVIDAIICGKRRLFTR